MAENSKIEWCDHTQNFWIGCTKVSLACDRCYAEVSTPLRSLKVGWGTGVPRHRTSPAVWDMPRKWNNRHEAFFAKHGRRQRVFSLSLGDWLDNEVPIGWLVDMLDVVRTTPNLDWLLLSKRIGNWRKRLEAARDHAFNHRRDDLHQWISDWLGGNPPANVWIGATICNQPEADRDIAKLLAVIARVRFLSVEPLLGPVDLTSVKRREESGRGDPESPDYWTYCDDVLRGFRAHKCGGVTDTHRYAVDWVIVGAESGYGARPLLLRWVRNIVRQCRAAGVKVLVKQLGREVLDDGVSNPGEDWPAGMVRHPLPRHEESDPGFVMHLMHTKGGDWSEWPEDLRTREYPA